MNAYKYNNQRGFTLIEIIVTIVLAAFMGSMLVQYMSTSLMSSTEPIVKIQDSYSLNQVLESMTADYKKLLLTDGVPLTIFKGNVEIGNNAVNDPYYGDYSIETEYIIFSGGTETPDTSGGDTILKVTITNNDQSLTALFTK